MSANFRANGYKILVCGYKTGQSESCYGETQTNINVVRDQSAQMDDGGKKKKTEAQASDTHMEMSSLLRFNLTFIIAHLSGSLKMFAERLVEFQ